MKELQLLQQAIFGISTQLQFEEYAYRAFCWQYAANTLYRQFSDMLSRTPKSVSGLDDLPYLPIAFFKSHTITCGPAKGQPLIFESSGTTGMKPSVHRVLQPELYHQSLEQGFEQVYGAPAQYRILALLPGYLERQTSSLVYMMQRLMQRSAHPDNGFYLNDMDHLLAVLARPCERTTLLIGVSFALLDLAERLQQPPARTVVIETGGMKGRRRELTRTELHNQLSKAFVHSPIHAEYGMTELLSQAWSTQGGYFQCPPWMKLRLREANDPLSAVKDYGSGGINVIDLANLRSCCFLATDDLGRSSPHGMEVLGRFDYSDLRGCNLLVA